MIDSFSWSKVSTMMFFVAFDTMLKRGFARGWGNKGGVAGVPTFLFRCWKWFEHHEPHLRADLCKTLAKLPRLKICRPKTVEIYVQSCLNADTHVRFQNCWSSTTFPGHSVFKRNCIEQGLRSPNHRSLNRFRKNNVNFQDHSSQSRFFCRSHFAMFYWILVSRIRSTASNAF